MSRFSFADITTEKKIKFANQYCEQQIRNCGKTPKCPHRSATSLMFYNKYTRNTQTKVATGPLNAP